MRKLLFVTHNKDKLGKKAIDILKKRGCEVCVLEGNKKPPSDAIAFFTAQNLYIKKEYFRTAAHRLINEAPEELSSTPFLIAVRNDLDNINTEKERREGFNKAVLQIAVEYGRWINNRIGFPWVSEEGSGKRKEDLEKWKKWADEVINGEYQIPQIITKKKKIKPRKKAWVAPERSMERPMVLHKTVLSLNEREKESLLIDVFGAFNFQVGMSLEFLHRIYLLTIKSLALVAEMSQPCAGEEIYRKIKKVSTKEIFRDIVLREINERGISEKKEIESLMKEIAPGRFDGYKIGILHEFKKGKMEMVFIPEIESLLVFGKNLQELTTKEKKIAKSYSLVNEVSHFQRIMDIDYLARKTQEKRLVGEKTAGNVRMVRFLGVAEDYRKKLGIYKQWPLSLEKIVEAANYKNESIPILQMKNYPHVQAIITASTPHLAKDMTEIFRRLVSSYQLETAIALLEDWLSGGKPDLEAAICAVQICREENFFLVKAVGIGKGEIRILTPEGKIKETFQIKKNEKFTNIEVGRLDFQHPIQRKIFKAEKGDDIILSLAGEEAKFRLNEKIRQVDPFRWTSIYVKDKLKPLIQKIYKINPKIIRVNFGHIHTNRTAIGPEQKTAAYIASILVEEFEKRNIKVEIEPMLDNYHVYDVLNVQSYLRELSASFGRKIDRVAFEASLLLRNIGDEIIKKLYQNCPEKIQIIGENIYLKINEGMMVELYEGVGGNMDKAGRQACVPFGAGYRIRRFNPELASNIFKKRIEKEYPESIIGMWWKKEPIKEFEQLTYKNVYTKEPEERAKIKKKMEEIDKPYKIKILEDRKTEILDKIIESIKKEKVLLLDFLEGEYDTQHKKLSALMATAGLLPLDIYRISFNSLSGRIIVHDINDTARQLSLL